MQDAVGARVKYGEVHSAVTAVDGVYFDNVKGGQQAAQHLLALGHHHIAFLGLVGSDSGDESGDFLWSQERENGWRTALDSAGYRTEGLVFRPKITPVPGPVEQIQAARQASENLIREEHVTAVVATNSFAARGLLEALSAAKIPGEKWPAVVCFDTTNLDGLDKVAHLTTLRMPWEDLGRTAADLLWERSHGQSDDSPQQRLVPMRLITRLTSRRNWAQNVQIPDVQDPAPKLHPAVA
ncbi:LacI family transcriptional regulator [bacterium]|nr:MAG: LacI family transcriptional regulator [bacterium]